MHASRYLVKAAQNVLKGNVDPVSIAVLAIAGGATIVEYIRKNNK